jgi:hypothetical protein
MPAPPENEKGGSRTTASAPEQAGSPLEQTKTQDSTSTDREVQPQFRNRRAFCVWAVSLGLVSHERLTEAIVKELGKLGDVQ